MIQTEIKWMKMSKSDILLTQSHFTSMDSCFIRVTEQFGYEKSIYEYPLNLYTKWNNAKIKFSSGVSYFSLLVN